MAIRTDLQLVPFDGILYRQIGIKVRKQVATARDFHLVMAGHRRSPDCDKKKIIAPGKMPARRLARLACGGEMDVAVLEVDFRSAEFAPLQRQIPFLETDNLVDDLRQHVFHSKWDRGPVAQLGRLFNRTCPCPCLQCLAKARRQ